MTKGNVTKVAKVIIDVADGMEVLGRRICNCGKVVLVIGETISEFIDPPKKNSAQNDLRRTKIMISFIVKILDVQIIGDESVLRMAIIFFYIFNEGIRLLENVRNIGGLFRTKLKSVLEQLHDREGEDKDA
ncbi:MAG: phage holin family protein [Acetatifactor sp.]|nr:phage holin family protein [Acetatifactor sp.]